MKYRFGSPFVNEGSGRIKTDPENEERIERILTNYLSTNPQVHEKFEWIVNKKQRDMARFGLPLFGFITGVATSFSFVHKNSKYIGKFSTLLMTYLGWRAYLIVDEYYNFSRRVCNFNLYPKEIRMMLDNNDHRYARKWLDPLKAMEELSQNQVIMSDDEQ